MQSSEQIQEQPYERRNEPRKKALMHAFVSDRADIVDLKCVIRDISKTGCNIASSYIQDLPRIIEIVPEGFDRPMTGKIIWRNSKVAGVQFLSASELEDFESEVPAGERQAQAAGFFGRLRSFGGARRRSGLSTRDEHRQSGEMPNFGMRVLHGVRNPLTAIKSLLKLLMGGSIRPIPKRARTIIKVAHENAEKAESLVEEALRAGKMKSGDIPCNLAPVDIVSLVCNSALVNTGFAAKYDVRFDVRDDVGKAMVRADQMRIEDVLANLLSSAAKDSPAGEVVTVSITRVKGSSNSEAAGQVKGVIRVSVSDAGLGSSTGDGAQGGDDGDAMSGLGMDISRSILERHDSALQIEARPGSGTTAWFELQELD